LVAKLLEPADNELSYANSIATYFQYRFRSLCENADGATVAAFESWVLTKQGSSPIAGDSALDEEGRRALASLSEEVRPQSSDSPLLAQVRSVHAWTVTQRHLVCVASFEEPITIRGRHACVEQTLPDGVTVPAMALPLLPDVSDAMWGPGFVRCFISPLTKLTAVTVNVGGKLIAVYFWGKVDEDLKKDFIQYELDATRAAKFQEMINTAIDRVNADGALDELVRHFAKESRGVAESVYTTYALLFTEDDRLEATQEKLLKGGLFSAADDNFSLVEAIAALSLATSLNEKKDVVREHLKARGHDFDEITAQCAKFKQTTGMPVVADLGEIILSYVWMTLVGEQSRCTSSEHFGH
jgi:hypothetical protein